MSCIGNINDSVLYELSSDLRKSDLSDALAEVFEITLEPKKVDVPAMVHDIASPMTNSQVSPKSQSNDVIIPRPQSLLCKQSEPTSGGILCTSQSVKVYAWSPQDKSLLSLIEEKCTSPIPSVFVLRLSRAPVESYLEHEKSANLCGEEYRPTPLNALVAVMIRVVCKTEGGRQLVEKHSVGDARSFLREVYHHFPSIRTMCFLLTDVSTRSKRDRTGESIVHEELDLKQLTCEFILNHKTTCFVTSDILKLKEHVGRLLRVFKKAEKKKPLSMFSSKPLKPTSVTLEGPKAVEERTYWWIAFLMQIPGVSEAAAVEISKLIPSAGTLMRELNCSEPQKVMKELGNTLSNIKVPMLNGSRRLGLTVAMRILNLYRKFGDHEDPRTILVVDRKEKLDE